MRKNTLCVIVVLIALLTSNTSLAATKIQKSCVTNNAKIEESCDTNNVKIAENTQEPASQKQSADIKQKKELLPLGDIFSSILKVPGDLIDGIGKVPLDDMVSSTLKIPGDAVNFVVEIPYDDIAWSTLEVSAEILEALLDDGFVLGYVMGHYCHHH